MTASPEMAVPQPAPAAAAKRNSAWDFTKGMLVLCIVLYHSLNYLRADRGGAMMVYLRFLPPSFIFIAGFFVTHLYLGKYRADDPRLQKRLLTRGAKLLAVFAFLNVLVSLFVSRNFNGMKFSIGGFFENLPEIFITGAGRRGIFLVLAPIAYLLMIAGPLLLAHQLWRWSLHAVFFAVAAADFILQINDYYVPNIGLIAFGLLGMVFGLSPSGKIEAFARHWMILTALCVGYFMTLNWWGDDLWLEYVGVIVMVAFFYGAGRLLGDRGFLLQNVLMLGSYSLLAYIGQIVILQLLLRVFRGFGLDHAIIIGFFSAAILMTAAIQFTDWMRKKWPAVDTAYRAVFA